MDAPIGELTQAIGEPMNGFPSPEERLGIMALNRARSDPATVRGPQSATYPARPPVLWHYDLSRSSRFHAINLQQARVGLMHTSPCKLNTNIGMANCNGAVACACATPVPNNCANCAGVPAVNQCGTDTFTRISYFGAQGNGEIAAAGYPDPLAVVDGWMDEAAGADGHRRNITDQGITSTVMGYGHAGSGGCWSSFDVSDSGSMNVQLPAIPTAAVRPASGGANAAYRFYATWVSAGGAPQSLYVVIDGQCTSMKQEMGTPTLNSTWIADANLPAGCHSYYVLGRDGNGGRVTYPSTGAINVAAGANCAADYVAQAPAASCDSQPPPDLAMTTIVDFAIKPGSDLSGVKRDMSVAGSDGAFVFDDDGGLVYRGHGASNCGCRAGGRRGNPGIVVLMLIGMICVARRRGGYFSDEPGAPPDRTRDADRPPPPSPRPSPSAAPRPCRRTRA